MVNIAKLKVLGCDMYISHCYILDMNSSASPSRRDCTAVEQEVLFAIDCEVDPYLMSRRLISALSSLSLSL